MISTLSAFAGLSLLLNPANAYNPFPCFYAWGTYQCGNGRSITLRRLQSDGAGTSMESTLDDGSGTSMKSALDDIGTAMQAALEDALASGELLNVSQDVWVTTLEHLAERGVSSRDDLEKLVFEETKDDTSNGVLEEVVLVAAIWDSLSKSVDSNNDGDITVQEWDLAVLDNWAGVPLPTTPEIFKNLFQQTEMTKDIFSHFFMASVSSGIAAAPELKASLMEELVDVPEGMYAEELEALLSAEASEGLDAPLPKEGLEAPLPEGLEAPEAPLP